MTKTGILNSFGEIIPNNEVIGTEVKVLNVHMMRLLEFRGVPESVKDDYNN